MFPDLLKKVLNGVAITPSEFSYKLQAHVHSFKLLLICDECKKQMEVLTPTHLFSSWKMGNIPRLLKDEDAHSILKFGLCSTCVEGEEKFPDIYDPRDVEEADAESRTIDE